MQTEASRAGTYARQAAYQKQHCLKTIKFEDKANKISGSVKKHWHHQKSGDYVLPPY